MGLRQPAAQETEGLGSTLPREASSQKVGAGKMNVLLMNDAEMRRAELTSSCLEQ